MKDPEASQEFRSDVVRTLEPGNSLGQSFHSRRADVNQIQIWLNVDQKSLSSSSRLVARLYGSPDGALLSGPREFVLNTLQSGSALEIPFGTGEKKLPAGDYYLELEVHGGTVQILGRNENAYAQGTLFYNQKPENADLSFRLSYSYGIFSAWEDLVSWADQIFLFLPLLALLWIPGRLILRLTRSDRRLDWGERSAISIGLSLSLVPLLFLWSSLLNLSWNQSIVRICGAILFLIYLFNIIQTWRKKSDWKNISVSWPMIALGAVFAASLAVRLAMVRDLAGPAWVDSVHHALITRLILYSGKLPESYAPFLQVSTTNYHTGYHSLLASFTWLSGLNLEDSMLVLGQFLNAFSVLAVYLFAKGFTKSQSAGIYAALMAGLLTPMPAYYTSWGRYTQLTGLLILPAAWFFIRHLIDFEKTLLTSPQEGVEKTETKPWIPFILGSLATAGLLLVHYRVVAFLVALISAYLIVHLGKAIYTHCFRKEIKKSILALGSIAVFALILTLPWWPSALKTFILPVASAPVTSKPFADFSWSYLNTALGKYVLGLAGLGLIWSAIQRRWFGLVLTLWVVFMFTLANLGSLHLPGANMINNTSVAISLFLPSAVLSGYLIGWIVTGWARLVPNRWRIPYWVTISLLSTALGFAGARALMPILNPGTLLIRQADLPAITWVKENIPENEIILVNPFLWGYGLFAGSDGGYWISPLAGRNTMPPAALYNFNFTGDQGQQISAEIQQVLTVVQDPEKLYAFLNDKGIHYIIIGARGGPLSREVLLSSPLFELIFDEDGVSIFATVTTATP